MRRKIQLPHSPGKKLSNLDADKYDYSISDLSFREQEKKIKSYNGFGKSKCLSPCLKEVS